MAEPISDLTASWINNTGIQLSWTAATDATTGSLYTVYVLQNVNTQIPNWVPVATLSASVIYSPVSSAYSIGLPTTSYLMPWSLYQTLLSQSLINATSVAFSIVHTDYLGAESIATNISAFQKQMLQPFAPPHLTHSIGIDGLGQFTVNPQNSQEEIVDSVGMFLGTTRGERTAVPGYGIDDLPFSSLDGNLISYQVSKWEPRARVLVNVVYDDHNNARLDVKVTSTSGGN